MNPALFTLLRLQFTGYFRRMTRGARSPRRAIFMVIGMGMILLWLGSVSISLLAGRQHSAHLAAPHRFRAVAPLALLSLCVLMIVSSSGDKAVAFTPGEVDMLFPGPFSRRGLLAFKLLKSALAALITALIMSLPLSVYAVSWPACYVGVFLTLLFIQFFSTAGLLLAQALTRRIYSVIQRAVLVLAGGVALFVARNMVVSHGGMHALYEFANSELGRNVLAPFDPFGRTITAADPLEFAQSAGEAALIDAGLLVIVVLLDQYYLEAAAGASARRSAQIQRIRSGSLLSSHVKGNATWRLPRPPWLGGAGPIAWRQATSAARSARGLLMVLVILAIVIGPLFGSTVETMDVARILIGAVGGITVMLSGFLKFDFRGDLDHMDELKALPLRPAAIVIGQIIVPTLILTAAHLLLLGGIMIATPAHRELLAVAAGLALPYNALLMAAENTIFLLLPSRPAAATPGDFQMLGRQAAQLMMKGFTVFIGLLIAFAVAAPLYILLGGPMIVLTLVAGAILLAETCALIPLMDWAFQRFDPSMDTPA
jgi:hypothetical protein